MSRTLSRHQALAVAFLLILLTGVNIAIFLFTSRAEASCLASERALSELDLSFIYPFNEGISNDDFLLTQRLYSTNHLELKAAISALDVGPNQSFGYYFESLNTGSWVGVNEKTKFLPLSLWKIPVMAATMKTIERGDLRLDTPVNLSEGILDAHFSVLNRSFVNVTFAVSDLLYLAGPLSDNSAAQVLLSLVDADAYGNAMVGLGLSVDVYENRSDALQPLSPKDYSNIFRSLYYSSYLSRQHSRELLAILAQPSPFDQALRRGVPQEVVVSHKIGFLKDGADEQHHDCGIVYYPGSPYILCVMTRGMTYDESNRFIADVSSITYAHMVSVTADTAT